MKIIIEAQGQFAGQGSDSFFREKLEKEFGKFQFINSLRLKFKSVKSDQVEVSLLAYTENGPDLFGSSVSQDVKIAFNNSIRKIQPQVEKYRVKHYQNI